MTKKESEREILIPRLKEALARYQIRQGEFLIDNAIMGINNILSYFNMHGELTPQKRSFALDLIQNSFRINIGDNK